MHLNCLQENLAQGLGIVQRAVATRTTLPITQHVLLSTDGGRLKFSATNLEVAISTWVGAEVLEDGAITIPARLLTDFINSLERQHVEIKTMSPAKGIELKGEHVQATMNGADASEFPPIPSVDEGISTKVAPKALRMAIHQVVMAAAVEDSRPVLTGVNVELEGTKLVLAAADGFRLAVHTTELLEPVSEKVSLIVPAKTLQEVERLIDGDDPIDIVVTPQRSQILFRLKNVEIVSQLIQGTFPNYSQLIPQERSTRAVVNLGELQRATRTASIFAKDGSGIVRIEVTPGAGGAPGKLTVSSRAEELGDNTGDIAAEVEGGDGKIAFNSRYLSDVLGVLNEEQVALEMTTSSSPGVIRPVGDDHYVHVVMPMFVQWG
ncbi:MAG: DNA polymerase III subunit beta [Chloroflexi bacterium]|nr:DNA polymerase III subunit beta [Chloroflexota bacterium]